MQSSSEVTTLAEGVITAAGDSVSIHLVRPADFPALLRSYPENRAVIEIRWPDAPTVVRPDQYADLAAYVTRLFAASAVALSRIKSSGKF